MHTAGNFCLNVHIDIFLKVANMMAVHLRDRHSLLQHVEKLLMFGKMTVLHKQGQQHLKQKLNDLNSLTLYKKHLRCWYNSCKSNLTKIYPWGGAYSLCR